MKLARYALLAAFLCASQKADAQALIALLFGKKISNDKLETGVQLGINESWITNTSGQSARTGFAIGGYLDIKLDKKKKWLLTNYFLFKSPKGSAKMPLAYEVIDNSPVPDTSDFLIRRELTYLELIPNIRYKLTPRWSVCLGMDLAFRTVARDEYQMKDGRTESLTYRTNTKDKLNVFDIGASAGIQYRLRTIRFDLLYIQDFTNIYKSSVPFRGSNGTIHIGVGIPIVSKQQVQDALNAENPPASPTYETE